MSPSVRRLYAMCSTAIADGNLWVPLDDAKEKRAARVLEKAGRLIVLTGLVPKWPHTIWICPTPKGLAEMKEPEASP